MRARLRTAACTPRRAWCFCVTKAGSPGQPFRAGSSGAQWRTENLDMKFDNLEIPGSMLSHRPGMTERTATSRFMSGSINYDRKRQCPKATR
jgi:hypothetical protein